MYNIINAWVSADTALYAKLQEEWMEYCDSVEGHELYRRFELLMDELKMIS